MSTTQQMRQNLHALIERVTDTEILYAVSVILEKEAVTEQQCETSLENEQDQNLKASLTRAIKDAENSLGTPHHQIWPELNRKYSR